MNQEQRRHFLKRVSEYEMAEGKRLRQAFTAPAKELSDSERCKLIRSGRVKLKSDVKKIERYDRIRDIFNFDEFEHQELFSQEEWRVAMSFLAKKTNTIRDQLQVCDTSTALKLMQQLS